MTMIKLAATPTYEILRELTEAEVLSAPRSRDPVKKLREVHHLIARLLACGLRENEVALRVGIHYQTISHLKHSPAFVELVAHYRDSEDAKFEAQRDQYYDLITRNGVQAERLLSDKLADAEESGELPSFRELIAISRDAADRVGLGKRSTSVNLNVDFAAQLDRAIARSDKVSRGERELPTPTTIEAEATSTPVEPEKIQRRRLA